MRGAIVATLLAATVAWLPGAALAEGPPKRRDTRQVMFVGNNWDGTADIINGRNYRRVARLNTIPDREERMAEIQRDPDKLGFFLGIRQAVGEGNDQFTDDMFTSHDGKLVVVSRPSFADVVAISLKTKRIIWRFPMEGYRSDHMAISPDGRSVLVSDSTANKVHRLETRTGRKTGEFESGDSPHENNYSKDGRLIFHASIGRVYTPTDQTLPGPLRLLRDTSKGDRWFQVVDARSLRILQRIDMGVKLREAGYEGMDSAVRPMALSPSERYLYFQVSFHHGFVEYDRQEDRVTRVASLPLSDEARRTPREEYLLDSAHHGLAMSPRGDKLCAAGTMSDYAAIVRRGSFAAKVFPLGKKPYWSTNGRDGRTCWVSWSGDDSVSVFSYRRERHLGKVPVGDHPQRVRPGAVRHTRLAGLPIAPGARDNLPPYIRVRRVPNRCRRTKFRAEVTVFDQSSLKYAEAARGLRRLRSTRKKRFNVTVSVRRLKPGRHRLRVRAKDAAGNWGRRVVRFRRCGR